MGREGYHSALPLARTHAGGRGANLKGTTMRVVYSGVLAAVFSMSAAAAGDGAAPTTAGTSAMNDNALKADNPFARPSTLPYELPPFDRIHDGDYLPAFHAGMREQLKEVERIAHNREPPTFENTLVALERDEGVLEGGRLAIVGDALDLLELLAHAGVEGRQVIAVVDPVEGRQIVGERARACKRVVGLQSVVVHCESPSVRRCGPVARRGGGHREDGGEDARVHDSHRGALEVCAAAPSLGPGQRQSQMVSFPPHQCAAPRASPAFEARSAG